MTTSNAVGLNPVEQDVRMLCGPFFRVITGHAEDTGLASPAQVAAPLFVVHSVTDTLPDKTLEAVDPVIGALKELFIEP